ncbi:MAG: hypothetical protein KJ674_03025 [Nanoarchaeota archaeon]|nr:hypothetical protein [Nanoarchaeota archaeon]
MATVMDLGLLEYILPVFSFLFVWVIVYAVMDKFNLAKNTSVKLLVSFCVGMLFLFSANALEFVNLITPWFVVLVIIALFLVAMFMFMGVKEDVMSKAVGDPRVYWTVIVIAVILLIIALINVFGSVQSPYDEADDGKSRESESLNTIVHPRVLGAIFLLVVASFATNFISRGLKPG